LRATSCFVCACSCSQYVRIMRRVSMQFKGSLVGPLWIEMWWGSGGWLLGGNYFVRQFCARLQCGWFHRCWRATHDNLASRGRCQSIPLAVKPRDIQPNKRELSTLQTLPLLNKQKRYENNICLTFLYTFCPSSHQPGYCPPYSLLSLPACLSCSLFI
jgi:hypothetical protein